MSNKKFIVWFEEVDKSKVDLVGGKGANLGEMTNASIPIPYGFIITSQAYFEFLKSNHLEKKIKDFLETLDYENSSQLQQVSAHIRDLINKAPIPQVIIDGIIDFYENLTLKEENFLKKKLFNWRLALHKLKHVFNLPLVAVRSSATAEDLPSASFAGQQETFLNIKGENSLILHVKKCWSSLFTPRAIYYRQQMKFDHFKVGLAVVVQRMVQSEKSGIAFSIDPVTNDKNKIVIEAIKGLGEYIVGGKVSPDHYEVDKKSFVILKKEVKKQNVKLVKSGLKNKEVKLSKKEAESQKITDEEIIKIALLVSDIEKHYYFPQDIEWAIEKDQVFIVQSRPITTIKQINKADNFSSGELFLNINKFPILIGSPASPGIKTGPVKIITQPEQMHKIKSGDVLVAPFTNPDYVPIMKKACAIVTEKGGRTSHAAIVSRELGIPAVVGAEDATKILRDEMIVTVNGSTGEIFKGKIIYNSNNYNQGITQVKNSKKIKTITKVYVNLAEPDQAKKIAALDVDGVGLLRAEFMIAQIGIHPKEFLMKRKEFLFINKLTADLLKFVKAFAPRPVIYRATDFKTNEYRHLHGGDKFEPNEQNPMLGFRGASRYIQQTEIFGMELQAIAKVWRMGYRNLHLMIPFVRLPWELIKIREIVKSYNLFSYPQFKLWIMVEVPSCALNLEEFLKVGVDGVSIGTNDLTMMLLGVDRDNEKVAHLYNESHPFVTTVLEYIVKTCQQYGVTSSICGQAASDYPEIIEKLVKAGITSVSVNHDVVEKTRQFIFEIEKKYYGKG